MKVFLAFFLAGLALASGQQAGGSVANTATGQIQGALRLSRSGRLYNAFRGVPYAKANRFQAPVAADPWQGVKDVSGPAPGCIHWDPLKKTVSGQEDCLNLNVYTPKMPKAGESTVLMPVVVYLHPGKNNFFDSEMFDAKYWMDENVVLVVPNWRQSVFGFLNTNDMYAPGNQGLRDQVKVLQWIKQNIAGFSGDKSRVTIMGSASGGADAVIHTLSPQSKGLFHGAVSMGLSPLSRHSIVRNPVKEAKKLGAQVGCPVASSQALVTCLQNKPAKEILEKMTKVDNQLNADDLDGQALFGPTIDNAAVTPEENQILPDHPIRLLGAGKIASKVPLIIGGNEYDGGRRMTAAMLKDRNLMDKVDKQWDELAPLLFMYKDVASDKNVVSSKIRKFYFQDKPITKEVYGNLSDIFMDRFMGFPVVVTAQLYSKAAPVYLYYFHHNPETPAMKFWGVNENYGMGHLDDLQYMFKVKHDKLPFPEISKESKEYALSKGFVQLFGSFAETGKPTKTWGEGKEWKKNEAGDVSNWYELGTQTALRNPAPVKFQGRVGFWLDVFGKEMAKENDVPEVDRF